jgi:hypothetical protein
MPLLNREEHEGLLNELLDAELPVSRKTEILQRLRVDNTEGHEDYNKLTESNTKLKSDNDDLLLSNSKLFRQLDIPKTEEGKKEKEAKTFSETITIEDLEKL